MVKIKKTKGYFKQLVKKGAKTIKGAVKRKKAAKKKTTASAVGARESGNGRSEHPRTRRDGRACLRR